MTIREILDSVDREIAEARKARKHQEAQEGRLQAMKARILACCRRPAEAQEADEGQGEGVVKLWQDASGPGAPAQRKAA